MSFTFHYIAPKAGYCPALTSDSGLGTCDQDCSGDFDCEGNAKCCSNGCGTVCGKRTGVKPAWYPSDRGKTFLLVNRPSPWATCLDQRID